ncbi:MAG: TolC family protein [Elusimicrobia bacterium]|nr:TolC family protein [Elusimicrobiota bacterium]
MNYRLFCKLLCAFFVGVFYTAAAYATSDFLEESFRIAFARNQQIRVAEDQINLSRIRVTNAMRQFFPQVVLQTQQSQGRTAITTDINTGHFVREEYRAESLGIRAIQPVFDGFRTSGMLQHERLMLEAARINLTRQREELRTSIKLAYYEYLTLKVEYRALGQAFLEVERLWLRSQNELRARAISELDLFEAENFRDKVQDMLTAARINLNFAMRRLAEIVGVTSLEDIGATVSDELPDDIPEIAFSLQDCINFALTNNLELITARIMIEMSHARRVMGRSRVLPSFHVEAFYGRSGEAFVTEPLRLTSTWALAGRLSWGFWGNSLAAGLSTDRTQPSTIIDASRRVENTTIDVSVSILDDLNHFIDARETDVNIRQTQADLQDLVRRTRLTVERAYNEYRNSLNNARTLRNEIRLRERRLALLRMRNELFEVPTLALMEESWRFAEAITNYSRATFLNHSSVTELESLTLMPLR